MGWPVRTLSCSRPQGSQCPGAVSVIAKLRTEPGASERNVSPSGVSPKEPGAASREDAEAGQQPQHPVQRLRVRADGLGELVAGRAGRSPSWSATPSVRDDADGLADPVAGDEAHHRGGRRNFVLSLRVHRVLLV